jgi:hypothetical protein
MNKRENIKFSLFHHIKWNKRGMIKLGAGIFMVLLFLILVFSLFFSSASTDDSYTVGEEVKLDLSKYESCSLNIKTPSSSEIQGDCTGKFSFKFEEPGKYIFDIKSSDSFERLEFQVYSNNTSEGDINQELEEINKEIQVINQETSPASSAIINPQNDYILFNFEKNNIYSIYDTLKFDFNRLGNYELIIISPSGKRISRVSSNDWFLFELSEEGRYSVKFERGNAIKDYDFTVKKN